MRGCGTGPWAAQMHSVSSMAGQEGLRAGWMACYSTLLPHKAAHTGWSCGGAALAASQCDLSRDSARAQGPDMTALGARDIGCFATRGKGRGVRSLGRACPSSQPSYPTSLCLQA